MEEKQSILALHSVMVVFAYAPAGFGHLRVTEALYHGLPAGVAPILLGSQDTSIRAIHRMISIHPISRKIMQWAQSGTPERLFTHSYRFFLEKKNKLLYQQMVTLLDQRMHVPKTVLIIATHFGLAHQLSVIKQKLEQERNIKVFLFVQVTDDSPQYIWYVPGADIIFVPSEKTKQQLIGYGKSANLPPVHFEVIPYPISPVLTQRLTSHELEQRHNQVLPDTGSPIHVAIPISGAAVGIPFITKLITHLQLFSDRFVMHVVAKDTAYTHEFLKIIQANHGVNLYVSTHDREVVETYEQVYRQYPISLEITKPSEQTFKALCHPNQRGGSMLLFTDPVGQQEYDNIDFLKRHKLLPTEQDQQRMWSRSFHNLSLFPDHFEKIQLHAKQWRGLRLPPDPIHAASFVWWGIEHHFFEYMMHFSPQEHTDIQYRELQTTGVEQFWQKITKYVEKEI